MLTNDSHYTDAPQHRAHEVLLCIGSNSTIHDEGRFRLNGDTFYLRSEAEMRTLFPELPEAADNTWRIAEQTDIKLSFEQAALPDPGVPSGMTAREYLRDLCEQGVRRRYPHAAEEHWERLRYELSVVEQTGFDEYMLIVADLARFAREQQIPMGVRGSAAASIVLYALDVTDIEPLQHNLVFERFLNPERIGMPDVDFDFADDRREEVIRYAAEKYGRDRVAQICTFGTLGAKAAIRDTGRALGMDFGAADRIARMVPDQLNIALVDALQQSPELRNAYDEETQVRELVDTARQLEGVSRHSSTHAAGVVITREPLVNVVPLQRPTRKDADENSLPTTQYAMAEIEKLKLLKVDFLGLTNLTILGRAVDMIREHRGDEIDLTALPDGDEATAELLGEGETFGVFQLESSGMRRYVMELKPQNISELSAMVALFRPGPMEHIPTFIDAKHGRVAPAYLHEDLADILDETYGVITYQDQVLHIARRFAGYTLGQAEVMRKAMGKKIQSMMLEERERFLDSVEATGYARSLAERLFDLIEPFAGYAFNKAHAVCYGTIAYQTAYLKAHYPAEYMAAVLSASGGSQDRIAAAIAECTRLGVEVLPPDVNHSRSNFALGPRTERRRRGHPVRSVADQERRRRWHRRPDRRARGEWAVQEHRGLRPAHQPSRPQPPRHRVAGARWRSRWARRSRHDLPRHRAHPAARTGGAEAPRDRPDLDVRPVRDRGGHAAAGARTPTCRRARGAAARMGERGARHLRLRAPLPHGRQTPRWLRHEPRRRHHDRPRR